MAMQPIDYSIDVKDPFNAALQGVQQGAAISDLKNNQAANEAARQSAIQMQRDMGALATNPNATGEDYAKLTMKYPQMADHFKKSWDMLDSAQQQSQLDHVSQVHAALTNNKTDIATKLLEDQAVALENSGKTDEATNARNMAEFIRLNPQAARAATGLKLSSIMGPEKFATTFSTLGAEQRASEEQPYKVMSSAADAETKIVEAANAETKVNLENEKLQADIGNMKSIIGERIDRLGLDKDKLTSDVKMKLYELGQTSSKMDADTKKLVNDSVIASTTAAAAADSMDTLATKFETMDIPAGLKGRAYEGLKSATGNQNAVTSLRQEYSRIRSSQVSKMLPPGAASDKDIALAMSGFPSETSDPQTMASFLRGMSKLSRYESAQSDAKAQWVNAVGSLGNAKQDIEINGVAVPAGSKYTDYVKQFVQDQADAAAADSAVKQVQGRSYMRHAGGAQ